jgi:hypothetical protein
MTRTSREGKSVLSGKRERPLENLPMLVRFPDITEFKVY